MRKWFLRAAWLVASLVVAVAGLFVFAWFKAEADMARTYTVSDPPLVLRGDTAERERGAPLYTVTGRVACHGDGGRGRVFLHAGPVACVVAPNLAPALLAPRYDADASAAAIRHGVRHDVRPLRVMPSTDCMNLSDADTAALVAYL